MSRRALIAFLFFAALIVAIPVAIIWPSIMNIQQTGQAILDEYQFLQDRHDRGLQMKRVRADYESAKQYLPGLQSLSLEPGKEIDFVSDIEGLASDAHVNETLNLDLDHPQSNNGGNAIAFTMVIQGTWINSVGFLHALRGLPVIVDIESIHATPLGGDSNSVSFNAQGFVFESRPTANP